MLNHVRQTLNELSIRDLILLNREFGLSETGDRTALIHRLIRGAKYQPATQKGGYITTQVPNRIKEFIIEQFSPPHKIIEPDTSTLNKLEALEAYLMADPEIFRGVDVNNFLEENGLVDLTPDQWANALISKTDPLFEAIPDFLADYLDFSQFSGKLKQKMAIAAIINDNVNLLKKVNLDLDKILVRSRSGGEKYTPRAFANVIKAIETQKYLNVGCHQKYGEGYKLLKKISFHSYDKNISDAVILRPIVENVQTAQDIEALQPTEDQLNSIVLFCNKIELIDPSYKQRPKIEINTEPRNHITVRDILESIIPTNRRNMLHHPYFQGIYAADDSNDTFYLSWGS